MKATDKRRDARELGTDYALADAEKMARKFPETFEIPELDERLNLAPGDYAKLIFRPVRSQGGAERMWVRVDSSSPSGSGTLYRGTLANEPDAHGKGLQFGASLSFAARHIIDVERATGRDTPAAMRARR
jgi:hypothetical protein